MMVLMGSALAANATAEIQVCIDFDVDFQRADDPGGTYSFAAGDYWTDNSVHQPARHVFVEVTDASTTNTYHLDAGGCAEVHIEGFGDPKEPIPFDLEVLGEAKVSEVAVELRLGDYGGAWANASPTSVVFTGLSAVNFDEIDLVVDAIEGWQHLVVATYLLGRQDWRLDEPTSRDCCLETGSMNKDGTCTGATPQPYERLTAPYLMAEPLIALYATEDDATTLNNNESTHCCGSKTFWTTSSSTHESQLYSGKNVQHRWALSHELGHVFAGIRMGGWEDGEYNWDPPMDGCAGDLRYYDDGIHGLGWNPLPQNDRGSFTKEAMARAMREGWADYVMAWSWNAPGNTSAEAVTFNQVDFDLDGDADNKWAASHPYDLTYQLGKGVEISQATGGDPTDMWVLGLNENWLGNAMNEGAGSCEPNSSVYCAPYQWPDMEDQNRATVYDVADMWWSLQTKDGLTPDELLDLYVDACPRGWREEEVTASECKVGDDLPYQRLLLSADYHGVQPTVASRLDAHVGY